MKSLNLLFRCHEILARNFYAYPTFLFDFFFKSYIGNFKHQQEAVRLTTMPDEKLGQVSNIEQAQ